MCVKRVNNLRRSRLLLLSKNINVCAPQGFESVPAEPYVRGSRSREVMIMRISPHASVLVYVEGPRVLCRTIDNALSRAVPVACNTLLNTLEFIKAWFTSTASIILNEILAKGLILIIFGSFKVSPDDCVITRLCKFANLFDDVLISAGKYRIDESTPFASFCRILEGYKVMIRLRGFLKDFLILKKSVSRSRSLSNFSAAE